MAALTAAVTKLTVLMVTITIKRITEFGESIKSKRSSDMKHVKRKYISTRNGGHNGKRKT